MTSPRSQLVDSDAPGFYHCVSRCAPRAFLCGTGAYSGRCFEHRKSWVEDRLLELAECFAIGVYAFVETRPTIIPTATRSTIRSIPVSREVAPDERLSDRFAAQPAPGDRLGPAIATARHETHRRESGYSSPNAGRGARARILGER